MRAVIISGGQIKNHAQIKTHIRENDTIICADSGYNHAVKMGLNPSIVVGDFDSIGHMPSGVPVMAYPSVKDQTDTEIAIEYARDKGFKDFLLLAATGSRVDHSLTNVLLLKGFLEGGENAAIIDEHNKIMLTDSKLHLREEPGAILSLVPLSDCSGVCTIGLEYRLNEADLFMGRGLGVSNVMNDRSATISLKSGLLLVIVAKD